MREIRERISVRKFKDQRVERKKIIEMLKAAMQAPSAGNQQPWGFVVVEDREMLGALSKTSPYATPLDGAAFGIAVLRDPRSIRFEPCIEQDLSAAVENLLLEAVHLDLGAVWLGVAPMEERVDACNKLLGIPEPLSVFALIAVGYPAEPPRPKGLRYDESKVHWEHWEGR